MFQLTTMVQKNQKKLMIHIAEKNVELTDGQTERHTHKGDFIEPPIEGPINKTHTSLHNNHLSNALTNRR